MNIRADRAAILVSRGALSFLAARLLSLLFGRGRPDEERAIMKVVAGAILVLAGAVLFAASTLGQAIQLHWQGEEAPSLLPGEG
jgi:hypothetical protein